MQLKTLDNNFGSRKKKGIDICVRADLHRLVVSPLISENMGICLYLKRFKQKGIDHTSQKCTHREKMVNIKINTVVDSN